MVAFLDTFSVSSFLLTVYTRLNTAYIIVLFLLDICILKIDKCTRLFSSNGTSVFLKKKKKEKRNIALICISFTHMPPPSPPFEDTDGWLKALEKPNTDIHHFLS